MFKSLSIVKINLIAAANIRDETLAINVTFACKENISKNDDDIVLRENAGHYTLSLKSTFLTFIDDTPGDIHVISRETG